MTTIIDQAIDATPELAARVRQAASKLEAMVGDTVLSVTAEWRVKPDEAGRPHLREILTDLLELFGRPAVNGAGRPLVELVLTDATTATSVTGRFTRRELRNSEKMEARLNRLWGNLLQEVSHKRMRRLRESVAVLED